MVTIQLLLDNRTIDLAIVTVLELWIVALDLSHALERYHSSTRPRSFIVHFIDSCEMARFFSVNDENRSINGQAL